MRASASPRRSSSRSPAAALPGAEHARTDSPQSPPRLRAALQVAWWWLEPDRCRVDEAGGRKRRLIRMSMLGNRKLRSDILPHNGDTPDDPDPAHVDLRAGGGSWRG